MATTPQFPVSPEKQKNLLAKMERLEVSEDELRERFVRGGGSGGQKINKTSVAVQLRHEPSGLEVCCQRTRSQVLNRYYARLLLLKKVEERLLGRQSEERQRQEKIRRQKRRRSRRAKEKILADKRRQSEKKTLRQSPLSEQD